MTDIDAARPDDASADASATPPVSREWARQQRRAGRKADRRRATTRATGPEGSPSPSEPTGRGGRGRSKREPSRGVSRRGAIAYAIATLVFVAGLVSLVWKGYSTSLEIKGGSSFEVERDPTKPGYEAQVATVPNHLVLHVDAEGHLTEAQLLVEMPGPQDETGDCGDACKGAGVVLVIPGVTLIETDAGRAELATFVADNGVEAGVAELERILGFDVTDTITVTPEQLTSMFQPAGPITIQNPDTLVAADEEGNKEIRYGAGPLTLEPAQVPEYLAFRSDGEATINRSVRLELVWRAWMAAIAEDPSRAPAVPPFPVVGGDELDLGGIIGRMAVSDLVYVSLPVQTIPIPGAGGAAVYRPDPEAIAELVPDVVPYPTSAFPGQRTRTRVLNGTADLGAATRAAPTIVRAGAEVTLFGNARGEERAVTVVEYHDERAKEGADRIAAALGVSATESTVSTEAYDVTVTLGADFTG